MRFAILIPAITAFGIAGCQVPPPITDTPVAPPAPVAQATPVAPSTPATQAAPATPAITDTTPAVSQTATRAEMPDEDVPDTDTPGADVPGADINAIVQDMDDRMAVGEVPPIAPEPPADDNPEVAPPQTVIQDALESVPAEPVDPDTGQDGDTPTATVELALAAPPSPVPPAPPPPPPPPPELAPQDLIGMDAVQLQQRLGDADFTRREGPVETWQYRFQTCVVDYFLYSGTAGPAVRSWAWRSPVIGGRLDASACRRDLAGRDQSS